MIVPPPLIQGIGSAGGYRMMVEDRDGARLCRRWPRPVVRADRQGQPDQGPAAGLHLLRHRPRRACSPMSTARKADMLGVPPERVFEALQVYLGSAFVNDFNLLGRTYRVTAQADAPFRARPPISPICRPARTRARWCRSARSRPSRTRPGRIASSRYNLASRGRDRWRYGAGLLLGPVADDDGEARRRDAAGRLSPLNGPASPISRRPAGSTAGLVFGMAVLFVFLVLAAQYRKPDPAAGDHPDRADVPARGDGRRESARHGQ